VLSLQTSVVQAIPSLQFGAVPDWQPRVGLHVSIPLQYRPSSQVALFAVWSQESVLSLQASVVHATPSAQLCDT